MPRQPFLPTYKNASVRTPANALFERPKIAQLVGECITFWAQVEAQMALALSAILKTNGEAGVAIFLTIRRSHIQRDALNAAAEAALTGHALETFAAISSIYKSLEGQRTDLAHGIFLTSDDERLADAILWMDPKEHTLFFAQWLAKLEHDVEASIDGIKEGLFVYRPKDIERLRDDIAELWSAALHFWQYLRLVTPLTEAGYQQLRALPQIQRELDLQRLAKNNPAKRP